ncbi:uncharacterized protein LOC135375498 [Ornithodoros turicata]|uniref:uncharacterized protein LOC135375498 n=1 Tax=Ornithodoros turicata TaxID=34597 RepID=UPI00313936FE
MSFGGITPPPTFLSTPGKPNVPWTQWRQLFCNFLGASRAEEFTSKRKKQILLHCLGIEGLRIYNTFPEVVHEATQTASREAGATPSTSTVSGTVTPVPDEYETALRTLDAYFATTINVVTERHNFRRRTQLPGESIDDFVLALRELSASCNFGAQTEDNLRDQFVQGVYSQQIRGRLLLDGSALTFSRAVDIAKHCKRVSDETQSFVHGDVVQAIGNAPLSKTRGRQSKGQTLQLHHSQNSQRKDGAQRLRCYRCGSMQHLANASNCPAFHKRCNNCGKVGHYATVCRALKTPTKVQELSTEEDEVLNVVVPSKEGQGLFIEARLETVPVKFLIDTGSSVSILQEDLFRRHFAHRFTLVPPRTALVDYSRRKIDVKGCFEAAVTYEDKHHAVRYFVVSRGTTLLGLDAIKGLGIHIEGGTLSCYETSFASSMLPDSLAQDFSQLFPTELGLANGFTHKVKVRQDVPPVIAKLRRLPLAVRDAVTEELRRLEKEDILERVEASEWVSPIVVIPKKDGKIRLCVDLREVNKAIIPDLFPLPHTEELLNALAGAQYFSRIDLRSAYHQVLLHPESRCLTTFITHDGLYRFKRVCIGLSSAPAMFQRMMSLILKHCSGVLCYIDDIIVFGRHKAEHQENLRRVLTVIRSTGLKLNAKCVFETQELEFLGHHVSTHGLRPLRSQVEAITHAPAPKDVATLRSFLGLVGFYSKFVPNFATVVEPMRALLRKNQPFLWTDIVNDSFNAVKSLFREDRVVHPFDPTLPVIVKTDASSYGLGAVLQQMQGNMYRTVAFASRTLSSQERKYAVAEREALACLWACEHWHVYLWGRPFLIRTDHQALVTLLSARGTGRRPLRLSRWTERLLRYNFTVEYCRGTDNKIADALSRLPQSHDAQTEELIQEHDFVGQIETSVPKTDLQLASRNDPILKQVMEFVMEGWPLKQDLMPSHQPFFRVQEELTVFEDLLIRGNRIVVPPAFTGHLFEKAPPDCRYAIVMVDYFSKWPEAKFCANVTASTILDFLRSVFAREGYPDNLVSDHGPQFISHQFEQFLRDRGIQHSFSSLYYPRANGLVERFNRVLS